MQSRNIIQAFFLASVSAVLLISASANAAIVYSNDFETNSDGFNVSDRNTFSSSTFLGRQGGSYTAVLTLNGLTAGAEYDLAFDLFIGGTWDGSLSFGPDYFILNSSSSGDLVNATFRNGFPIGADDSGQTYSDATPLGGATLFGSREGADVIAGEPTYFFGHGAGNPMLSFIAGGTTEFLTFRSVDYQGIGDEFFALDNVVVSTDTVTPTVPVPAALPLLTTALIGLGFAGYRRRKT
ncbi:MAG: PEP-CTERM sorting domain-containing protein [Rhodospirillaceae bacterium]|jgi:hypothetical protein|nr:PEP-CTERM sorting domain-containing protein [Rhodospirillaceae bacterium]MBT4042796.1 PEP-CTERM sorting domain-containing protein [Rhodospirillaceae bacterium]MBT4687264.1 PEP-CTERM sorting domain-containing protein [Rhodospirillaceae bacterium]MBT5082705.1 PEP-CTERM sorting domain-containing protein [Rhodospirillaceae bacterium]MBT5524131.1 PEP-CTERM sorting domain-containing protein [Rhodospirillaceae bacterium]